jgi:hypothetical protein
MQVSIPMAATVLSLVVISLLWKTKCITHPHHSDAGFVRLLENPEVFTQPRSLKLGHYQNSSSS